MTGYNKHLIGLTILHRNLGAGVIHAVFTQNKTDYFTAEFANEEDGFILMEFRVDLLIGWGGYFRDETAEINKRQTALQRIK
jgi:hypothetical protein